MRICVSFLALVLCAASLSLQAAEQNLAGCWFLQEQEPEEVPSGMKSVTASEYFRIYYDSQDPLFTERDGIPDILKKWKPVMDRSRHFLQTELGWKLPASRREWNRPELDIYFVDAPQNFIGTTRLKPTVHIVLNRRALLLSDFPNILIHQLAHAAQLAYKIRGEYWLYEATASWMETQFYGGSKSTRNAQRIRMAYSSITLTDSDPVRAAGVSRLFELMAQPYPDLIRQIWQQYSDSREETALETIARVLALNHLPDLESYLQNYFLAAAPQDEISSNTMDIILEPYSAVVLSGVPDQSLSGGIHLSFAPQQAATFSTSLIVWSRGDEDGTLTMKRKMQDLWSVPVPFSGMDRYKLVVTNSTAFEIKGTLRRRFDSTIPAVLEYFHANAGDGGVQLEWKTAGENGVAFWNLYRLNDGTKERLNQFPIPASIDSRQGIRYVYVDTVAGDFYSLEAITSEGFPAPLGNAQASR